MVGGLVTMTRHYFGDKITTYQYAQCHPSQADYWVAYGGKAEAYRCVMGNGCLAVCEDAFESLSQRKVYAVTAPSTKADPAVWERWAAKWSKKMV